MIASGIGQREHDHIPRPADVHAKRGIGRQIRREVLWRATFKGHTHEMPEFVATLVVVIIYVAPVRRDPSRQHTFRPVRQWSQLAARHLPGAELIDA